MVFQKGGALGSLKGQLIGGVIAGFVFLAVLRPFLDMRAIPWKRLGDTIKFSVPLIPHTLATWALALSDRLILGQIASVQDVGLYSLAYQIAQPVLLLAIALSQAWWPYFMKTMTDGKGGQAISRFSTYYVAMLTFGGAIWFSISEDVLRLITPPAYHQAARALPWILGSWLATGLYFLPIDCLYFMKRTTMIGVCSSTAALLNIALNVLLDPHLGMVGAAMSTFLTYTFLLAVLTVVAQRDHCIAYETHRILLILGIGFTILLATMFLRFPSPLVGLVVRLPLAVLILFVLLFATKFFSGEEIRRIKVVIAMVPGLQRFVAS